MYRIAYKVDKQRVRTKHRRAVFGVELYAYVPMFRVGKFDYLRQVCLRVRPRQHHTVTLEAFGIIGVKFVAVSVSFEYSIRAIYAVYLGVGSEAALERAETHCSAHIYHIFLTFHNIYHRIGGILSHFGRMCIGKPQYIAGKFYRHTLHTETNTEAGDIVFASIPLSCPPYRVRRNREQ